ncbi:MAG: type II toxin-antitoxin system VapC family toxin [Nitriliruptor sp.]|uniref:type II toxin-antitoxin system VapC family toxin n=1 Tax=Nitriliruptor sp. TaxID=2448056 RepID=UPI00349FDA97
MKLTLDTHIFLWAVTDDRRLPDQVRAVIEDPAVQVYVSAACVWEIAIKVGLGRLDADPAVLVRAIGDSGFEELPVTAAHAAAVGRLEPIHRDPFDRMLLAQAVVEDLTVATVDEAVRRYPGVRLLPAG